MKFKVGDKVKIKGDNRHRIFEITEISKGPGDIEFVSFMVDINNELVSKYIPKDIWYEKLTERERLVYNMRSNGVKLKEIAAKFNVGTERIRQIYRKVEMKLRYYLKRKVYYVLLGLSKVNNYKNLVVKEDLDLFNI